MFEALMGFGWVFLIVGLIMLTTAVISRYTEGHREFTVQHKLWIVLGGVLLVPSIPMIVIGLSVSTNNNFYSMYEEYETAVSEVLVMEEKAETLQVELTALLGDYVAYEGGLITALQNRDSEDLIALFEQYPNLLASENVRQVTEAYIALTEDIVGAKVGRYLETGRRGELVLTGGANPAARRYNIAAKVLPNRWFIPGDLPGELPLYEVEEK